MSFTPTRQSTKLVALLSHSAELYRRIRKSSVRPSALVSQYLHQKKSLRSPDRLVISALVLAALRADMMLRYCLRNVPSKTSEEQLILIAALVLRESLGLSETDIAGSVGASIHDELLHDVLRSSEVKEPAGILREIRIAFEELNGAVTAPAQHGLDLDAHPQLLATRVSMPFWILTSWNSNSEVFPDWISVFDTALAMLRPAEVAVRVRTTAVMRDEALAWLHQRGIGARASVISPAGIVLSERIRLTETNLYRDGYMEIQDEASQLVAYALDPRPGQMVLDACAGAGGKSLHLADLMSDDGTIIAMDTESRRLHSLHHRAKRAGMTMIESRIASEKSRTALLGKCDAALVDAPCSGLGTARRNPMVKYRLSESMLRRLTIRQLEILENIARCVRSGGTLVYATCSLMPEENEQIVDSFLQRNADWRPNALQPVFRRHGIAVPSLHAQSGTLTLLPNRHGTDGFFIARLHKQ